MIRNSIRANKVKDKPNKVYIYIPILVIVVVISVFLVSRYRGGVSAVGDEEAMNLISKEIFKNKYPGVKDEDIKIARSGMEYDQLVGLAEMASSRNMRDESTSLYEKVGNAQRNLEKTIIKYGLMYFNLKESERQPDIKDAIEYVMAHQGTFVGGDRGTAELRNVTYQIRKKIEDLQTDLIKIKSK